jgi:hypothetical protein
VLCRRARRVGFRREVFKHVQARRRLPEHQREQREEGDKRLAGGSQESYLGSALIL